jgi:hypothetical protein
MNIVPHCLRDGSARRVCQGEEGSLTSLTGVKDPKGTKLGVPMLICRVRFTIGCKSVSSCFWKSKDNTEAPSRASKLPSSKSEHQPSPLLLYRVFDQIICQRSNQNKSTHKSEMLDPESASALRSGSQREVRGEDATDEDTDDNGDKPYSSRIGSS